MSVPPDQFDENGNPIEPEESPEERYVEWRGLGDPPNWFLNSGDILGELEDRNGFFNWFIDPYGYDPETGLDHPLIDQDYSASYGVTLKAYDEYTGQDIYWRKWDWSKSDWVEFWNYTKTYYSDISYWGPRYTPDMLSE